MDLESLVLHGPGLMISHMRRFGMLREVPAGQRELRQCEATAKLSVVSSVWTLLCTHGLVLLS